MVWKRSESLWHLSVMPAGFVAASLNPFGLAARSVAVPENASVAAKSA